MCRDDPAGEIAFSSGVHCVVGDVITHAKFYANWFRGFGVLTTPTLPFSIGLVGCPYNSVSITVQHCDSITALRLVNHDVTQLNIHRESKKGATLTMAITLSILGGFAKFFHCCKEQ